MIAESGERDMAGSVLIAVEHELNLAPPADAPPVLEVEDLRDETLLDGVSFSIRPGEVVGLAGLTGAGRTETVLGIIGLRPVTGRVLLDGQEFTGRSPKKSLEIGMVLVSEDRRSEQAFLGRSVKENLTAVSLGHLTSGLLRLLSLRKERSEARELAATFDVRSSSIDVPMVTLSGGNQQKVVLARWFSQHPRVVLLDEPTKGVDVGAKAEVHRLIADLTSKGVAVVLVSSDLSELFTLSHRILVLHSGRVVDEQVRGQFDATRIVKAASSGHAETAEGR